VDLPELVATRVTGFGFPFDHLLPSHKVGIISLMALAVVTNFSEKHQFFPPQPGDVTGDPPRSFAAFERDYRRDFLLS